MKTAPQIITASPPVVLAERLSPDGVRWQARISEDRGRLEVVGIVPPSITPTIIAPLSEPQLRELLADVPAERGEAWICAECRTLNAATRRWCATCSAHDGGER